jgi:non-specific serine/threonine protein kinase
MCVALVLLCGCSYQSSAAKYATYKQYLHQLVGDCARVDIQLMKLGPNPQPGQVADQLAGFAKKARSHTPPTVKRQKLANLLTEFDHAVREFRSAQTALNSGNTGAAHAAEKRAMQTINGPADRAARQYGMPHLTDCAKEMGLHQQGTSSGRHAWQSGTDSLYAVQQVPAAVVKNRIWVVGGLTSPLPSGLLQSTADTEFYDPTTREWGRGPQLPVALNHAMMVTYQGTLWVIGGFVPRGGNPTAGDSARVLMLNQAENAWIEKPMLHHARAAGAAAVVGNKIVVVGGRTGDPGKPVTVTEVFNGTSWQDATAIPTPADHLAAASDGKYLYAVGGDKLSTADDVAAVQRFNPATGTWSQLPPMSAAASGVGAAVVDGQLITLGGENLGTVFNTVRELDLATRAWSSLPPLPEARHGMGVAVIGTTLYAVGGAAGLGHTQSSRTVQTLILPSPSVQLTGSWQVEHSSLYAVQQVPAAVVKNRIWVVGGLTSPLPSGLLQSTADTEFYDPTTREWGRGPQLPVALNHAMMVTYQGTLWVIGGFVPRGGNPTAGDSARVLMLNQAENAWIEKPMLHHARAAGAAAVVGNKIVVVGGRTGDPGKPVTVTEVFNGTSWQDATAIPTPADHLAAASDGKYLYAVGGDKLSTADDVAAVQRFNPATGTWSQLPPMSAAASGVGAAVVDGQLITLGGENLGTVFNTVRELDLATRAWSSLPPLPEARHGMGVAVIGTTLYAVGGAAQPGHTQSTHALQVLTLHPR